MISELTDCQLLVRFMGLVKLLIAYPALSPIRGLLQKRTNLQQPLSYVCMYRQNQEIAKTDEH